LTFIGMHSNVFRDCGWSVSSTPSFRDQAERKKELLSQQRTETFY
jgi:hypothetical protein